MAASGEVLEGVIGSAGATSRADYVRALCLRVIDSAIPEEMHASSPEVLRRARIIVSFTLVLIVLGLEAALFFSRTLPPTEGNTVVASLAVALGFTLCIPGTFRRTGSLELGAFFVNAGSFLVIVTCLCLLGGIRAPLLHWLGVIPMNSALMGARRGAVGWALLGGLTLLVFIGADAAGFALPNHLDLANETGSLWLQRAIDVGSWLALLLTVALLYEGHTAHQTTALARKNAELETEIRQRSIAEDRTNYLAYYDELTGLPNRRLFHEHADRAIRLSPRRGTSLSIFFLDLDGFKEVNDRYGHAVGDELLQAVAKRLQKTMRNSDSVSRGKSLEPQLVSRLGGDEFTILAEDVGDDLGAAIVANRIIECLANPFQLSEHEIHISASIGVALYPGEAESLDDLLRNADLAMYHAKDLGKNNFQFFEEAMNVEVVLRSTLTDELRSAIENGELVLHYQPIVAAGSHAVVSVEALVRWQHPSRGLLAPAEFIGLAEESRQIESIGEWVLQESCRQYLAWKQDGVELDRISVNISTRELQRGQLVERVSRALDSNGLHPSCLELEITESAMLRDESEAERCLGALKAMGVGIALDDFGTGYSSLSYLKRFRVDALKVDRSFVSELESNEEARAISVAIIAMARQLGLRVVAEGVESEPVRAFLEDHGCDELQGYLFSRPMPANAALAFIRPRTRGGC